MQTNLSSPGALSHLRVVEVGDLPAAYCARLLGDLGADVVKVEPPGGDPSRWLPPFAGDSPGLERSLTFFNANLNKRSIVLDLPGASADRDLFARLLARADILVEATPMGTLEAWGLVQEALLAANPRLVTVSLTPFGQTGPHSGYKANDAIAQAVGGLLYIQGDDTRPPCPAPAHQAYQIAGVQGAFLAIAAARHARRSGAGQRIDLSLQEAMSFVNSGAISRFSQKAEVMARPGAGPRSGGSNVYLCRDGRYIIMTIVLPAQWRALVEWMEDPVLTQPEWENREYRVVNAATVNERVSEFAAQRTAEEFVEEAQRRRVPCAYVNTPREFLDGAHLAAREWLQEVEHPVIGRVRVPGPPFRMSATPMQVRRPAPLLDQHRQEIVAELEEDLRGARPSGPRSEGSKGVNPLGVLPSSPDAPLFEGIRVADLTRAFAGPIGTMMAAFYGAEVIKVESEELPATREVTSTLYAEYNRNKLSCAVDLRHPEGKEVFRRLLAVSDVLVDNFSPHVVDRLGFGYQDVRKVNPRLVQVTMPGMGLSGPLMPWVTYGTEIEASCGLVTVWGYPESPVPAHAKIVLPDYIGACLQALAVAAAIEARDMTGEGQLVEACQVEGQAALLGPVYLDYLVNGREWTATGYGDPTAAPYAPYGCYPCKGQDAWVVIACGTDAEWSALVKAMGSPSWAADPRFTTAAGRRAHAEEIDAQIGAWTRGFTPYQAFRLLQGAKIPAGPVMTGEDLYRDPHLRARGQVVEFEHPRWGRLAYPGVSGIPSRSPARATGPTPWIGDHNGYVFRELLGMTAEEVREREALGALK